MIFVWIVLLWASSVTYSVHQFPSTLETASGTEQLVVTMADKTYAPFMVDWAKRLNSIGTFRYIIEIGNDPTCGQICADHRLSCTSITSDYTKGSKRRHMILARKTLLLARTVNWGYDVVFTEFDVYWNKNIAQAFLAESILYGTDLVLSSHMSVPVPNTGALFVRYKNSTAKLFTTWFGEMSNNKRPKFADDQTTLNALLGYPGMIPSLKPIDRVLGLKHHMIGNTTIVLYEQDVVFREVYKACAETTSSNFLLAGFHFTNMRLGSGGKKTCLSEIYTGHFHNMICPTQGEKTGECEVAIRWINDDPFLVAKGLSIHRRKNTPMQWAKHEEAQLRRVRESWKGYYNNRQL
jgi:hypothetical protein